MSERELKDKARKDGVLSEAGKNITAAYLTSLLAMQFIRDADDALSEYKLMCGHDKMLLHRSIKALELFLSTFTKNCFEEGENSMMGGNFDMMRRFIDNEFKKEIYRCPIVQKQEKHNSETKLNTSASTDGGDQPIQEKRN